ncbi:uncharacterized protein METZ01_LOCUS375695, partial [marine metagenome]
QAALYPFELIQRYVERIGISLNLMTVVIMGVAFKGRPETTDMRGSVAIDLLNVLKERVRKVIGWDAIIEPTELESVGFETTNDLRSTIEASDVVLILNNHPENVRSELYCQPPKQRLLFDGWGQLDVVEVEKISGLNYATMGYMTQ